MTRGVGAAQPVGVVGAEYGKCMSWRGIGNRGQWNMKYASVPCTGWRRNILKLSAQDGELKLEAEYVPKNGLREVNSRTTHPNSSFPSKIACVYTLNALPSRPCCLTSVLAHSSSACNSCSNSSPWNGLVNAMGFLIPLPHICMVGLAASIQVLYSVDSCFGIIIVLHAVKAGQNLKDQNDMSEVWQTGNTYPQLTPTSASPSTHPLIQNATIPMARNQKQERSVLSATYQEAPQLFGWHGQYFLAPPNM